tara:strand:- start:1569 stop:3257 length:1689 start_codon:yes stop_codon:yes gene_type:complete
MSKEYNIEFDDALLDLEGWKRPRHYGTKLNQKTLNKYTPGDTTFGKQPVIERKTNALYIANVIRDASDDPDSEYTVIKNHSYIAVEKLLLINQRDDTVTVIEGKGVGEDVIGNTDFLGFNRYLTSDFRTGTKFHIKMLDESVQTNLNTNGYYVKMNKGYLYPSFKYNFAYDVDNHDARNGMYFYNHGKRDYAQYVNGNEQLITGPLSVTPTSSGCTDPTPSACEQHTIESGSLRFRYANFWGDAQQTFEMSGSTPSFASSSILNNQFTRQYYSASFGEILGDHAGVARSSNLLDYPKSGIGSASQFIGVDTLQFLKRNNQDPNIDQVDKTELHLTLFEGTKDFAPGFNDERSISTFEVDPNQDDLPRGDECNSGLPLVHEFRMKGTKDHRFTPSIEGHTDQIRTLYFTTQSGGGGCNTNADVADIQEAKIYCQGGNVGQRGFYGYVDPGLYPPLGQNTLPPAANNDVNYYLLNGHTEDNYSYIQEYSGSFNWTLSFLKKDHVIISDIDYKLHIPNGIGNKGVVLIPEALDGNIKKNINYYLQQAGLLETKITKNPISNKKFK